MAKGGEGRKTVSSRSRRSRRFSVGTPLRLRFGDNGIGGVLTTNEAGNFEVHVSTNLAGTNSLRLNVPLTVTDGQIVFEDGESVSLPRRFYRVIER